MKMKAEVYITGDGVGLGVLLTAESDEEDYALTRLFERGADANRFHNDGMGRKVLLISFKYPVEWGS